jgi:hypothetical protein
MPVTPKVMFRGAATTTTATTLYTVPASPVYAIVTNIVVTNTAATAGTFTLGIDGIPFASATSIGANSIAVLDIKQVIPAAATPKTITGGASATTISYHISGVEVS